MASSTLAQRSVGTAMTQNSDALSTISGNTLTSQFLLPPGDHIAGPEPQIGDKVLVGRNRVEGVLRFAGETGFAHGKWLGIELDAYTGKNDGSVQGVRYFNCAKDGPYGIFVRAGNAMRAPRCDATPSATAFSARLASDEAVGPPPLQMKSDTRAQFRTKEEARRNLAMSVEEHDLGAIRTALDEAQRLGVSPTELEAAMRLLTFETQRSLLSDMDALRSEVRRMTEAVEETEARARRAEERASEAERVNDEIRLATEGLLPMLGQLMPELEARVWERISGHTQGVIEEAVAEATRQLAQAAAEMQRFFHDIKSAAVTTAPPAGTPCDADADRGPWANRAGACAADDPSTPTSACTPGSPRPLASAASPASVGGEAAGAATFACESLLFSLGSQKFHDFSTGHLGDGEHFRCHAYGSDCGAEEMTSPTDSLLGLPWASSGDELPEPSDAVDFATSAAFLESPVAPWPVAEMAVADAPEQQMRDAAADNEEELALHRRLQRQAVKAERDLNVQGSSVRRAQVQAAEDETQHLAATNEQRKQQSNVDMAVHSYSTEESLRGDECRKQCQGQEQQQRSHDELQLQTAMTLDAQGLRRESNGDTLQLIAQLFDILCAGGPDRLTKLDFRCFAIMCSLTSDRETWDKEYKALCANLGWDERGLTLEQFTDYVVERHNPSRQTVHSMLSRAAHFKSATAVFPTLAREQDGRLLRDDLQEGPRKGYLQMSRGSAPLATAITKAAGAEVASERPMKRAVSDGTGL